MKNHKNLSVAASAFWTCILYCVCCTIASVQDDNMNEQPSPTTQHHHLRRRESQQISEQCEERMKDMALRVCSKCQDVEYDPVCGSDGITYYSHCDLECASARTYPRFRQRKIALEKWGACEESMRAYERTPTTSSSGDTRFRPNF